MSVGVVAAVGGLAVGAAGLYAQHEAGKDSKAAAKDVQRTAIENIQFLASQGIDASNLLGEGGQESLKRLGLTFNEDGSLYEGGVAGTFRDQIENVLGETRGSFGKLAEITQDAELGETGGIQQLISDKTSKKVLDQFEGQSPAVQKEIMRLADIEGRKAQSGTRKSLGRFADIETGAKEDLSNFEVRNTGRLASILQNVPTQQANALLGSANKGIPFVETAQEASALGDAAGRVSNNAQLEQLSSLLGGISA